MENWHKIVNKLNSAEYNPKGRTIKEGLNCFTMITEMLNYYNHNIPISEDGIITGNYTYDNIVDNFKNNNTKTVNDIIEYMKTWTDEITKNKIKTGDPIIIKNTKTKKLYPGIYSGNGKYFSIIQNGTSHVKIGGNYMIDKVFRGKKCS